MATIGERIKTLRKKAGLTQSEFGDLFGVVKSTVSSYEHGNSFPDDQIKVAICKHFNVSLDYLLGESDSTNKQDTISDDDIKIALFGGEKDIPEEVWDEVKRFAQYAKERYGNRSKNN